MTKTNQNSIEIRLDSEADTQRLAAQLAKLNLSGSVWLSGDLGAGKTTLTRYWLQALGHKGAVKSPTYTLVEPYHVLSKDASQEISEDTSKAALKQRDERISAKGKPVYHVDLYRLQDPEELSFIGFDEYQDDPDALVIIEWASRAEDYLAKPLLLIQIEQLVDPVQLEGAQSKDAQSREVQQNGHSTSNSRQVRLILTEHGQDQGYSLQPLVQALG